MQLREGVKGTYSCLQQGSVVFSVGAPFILPGGRAGGECLRSKGARPFNSCFNK